MTSCLGSCLAGVGHTPKSNGSELRPDEGLSEDEFKRRLGFLAEVPLFRRLQKSQYPLLARVLRARRWQNGETVLDVDQPSREFFFIAQGSAEVRLTIDGMVVAESLRPGDYFGEKCLEQGSGAVQLSPVKIVAVMGLVTLSMTAQEFEEHGLTHHLRIPRRLVFGADGDPVAGTKSMKLVPPPAKKTEEEKQFMIQALRNNANLRSMLDLSQDVLESIIAAAERRNVEKGTTLIKRGDYGDKFFIIESGMFEFGLLDQDGRRGISSVQTIASEMRRRLQRKEQFFQVLSHAEMEPGKEASVSSSWDPAQMRAAYKPVGRGMPTLRREASLESNSCIEIDGGLSRTSETMTAAKVSIRENISKTLPPLSDVNGFTDESEADVRRRLQPAEPFSPKSRRRSENGMATSGARGGVIPKPTPTEKRRKSHAAHKAVAQLEDIQRMDDISMDGVIGARSRGESFGEVSVLYNAPQPSSAVAVKDSVVWVVSQASIRSVMLSKRGLLVDKVKEYLDKVELMSGLLSGERYDLAQNFIKQSFVKGDIIVHQGEKHNLWYVIIEGECVMNRAVGDPEADAELEEQQLTTLTPGQYFGERALCRDKPSEFSVEVTSPEVRCIVLDGRTFKEELVPLLEHESVYSDIMEADLQDFVTRHKPLPCPKSTGGLLGDLKKKKGSFENRSSRSRANSDAGAIELDPLVPVDTRALRRLAILGMGAFGLVTLEEDPITEQRFAMKTLSKGHIVKEQAKDNVWNEREILTMMESPFVVRLFATWKDKNYIYFLFEPVLGGELHALLHKTKVMSDIAVVHFSIACLVGALEHLHERHVVFRDLKPENVLVSQDGYLKLCDFGFAKFVLGRAMSLCGTPDYIAPEILDQQGYDRMVDWWALGVVTFELLSEGCTPFGVGEDAEAQSIKDTFANVRAGIDMVRLPFTEPVAVTFVKSLLDHSPSKRLGNGGAKQVMNDKFLSSIDFDLLRRAELPAPFVPCLESEADASYFDAEDQEPPPFEPYEDDGTNWDANF